MSNGFDTSRRLLACSERRDWQSCCESRIKSADEEECNGDGKEEFVVQLLEYHIENRLESVSEGVVLEKFRVGVAPTAV